MNIKSSYAHFKAKLSSYDERTRSNLKIEFLSARRDGAIEVRPPLRAMGLFIVQPPYLSANQGSEYVGQSTGVYDLLALKNVLRFHFWSSQHSLLRSVRGNGIISRRGKTAE